ncbi:MAG: monofunctional biosynthetic peptidoglycan transglycosylase [Rickettsiales bacterium]|nr:monofunctional biosynthetic peptidoglycan transglycosylase [Rickettsiales bacterium]
MNKTKSTIAGFLARFVLCFVLFPYVLALLYVVVPPVSTWMLADWLAGEKVTREWVPLKQISPSLIAAVMASEDDAFCDHWGVDFTQLEKSWERSEARDKPLRATSTITMQTAKNLFLWSERSWVRKMLEIPLTFWLELTWSKRRILEVYLNIAEWGPGIYGAQAAAKYHFGTSARGLSLQQAALLATSLPNPIKRNASHPGPAQQAIAAQLLTRIHKAAPNTTCLK